MSETVAHTLHTCVVIIIIIIVFHPRWYISPGLKTKSKKQISLVARDPGLRQRSRRSPLSEQS